MLNPFPKKPWFLHVCNTSLLKTLQGKEKLLVTSKFSSSLSVFYPFGELSPIFIQKLSSAEFWKSLKFVVWQRVKKHNIVLSNIPCGMMKNSTRKSTKALISIPALVLHLNLMFWPWLVYQSPHNTCPNPANNFFTGKL